MMEHDHSRCKDLLGSLSDYVDGTLGEQICLDLERHISECHNCRVVVDTLRKTVSLYHQSTETAEVPSAVRERLYRTLHLEEYLG